MQLLYTDANSESASDLEDVPYTNMAIYTMLDILRG